MDQLFKAVHEINQKIPEDKKKNADPQELFGLVSQHMCSMLQSGDLQESISLIQKSMGSMGSMLPPQVAEIEEGEEIPKRKSKVSFGETTAKGRVSFDTKSEKRDEEEVESVNDSEYDDDDIQPKTPDLHYNMKVKLSDLYTGKKKKIAFKRTTYEKKNGKYETSQEKKKVVIPIIPGTKHGEQITFRGESDRNPGHVPGDVIITISEEPDETFIRDNNNLLIVKDISLSDNYSMEHVITHLDGRKLKICSKEGDVIVSSTNYEASDEEPSERKGNGIRKIRGEGMPIKNSDERGDLYVRFNLKLPQKLSEDEITKLKEIIPSMDKQDNNDNKGADNFAVVVQLEHLAEDDFYLNSYDYYSDDSEGYSESEQDEDEEDEEDDDEYDEQDDDGESEQEQDETEQDDDQDEEEDPLAILGKEEEEVKKTEVKEVKKNEVKKK